MRIPPARLVLTLTLAWLATTATATLATTPIPRTASEAAAAADWIVDADVLSVSTDPSPPFPGVWSTVRLRVRERIAGEPLPSTIELSAPGGKVGDSYRFVVGAPFFSVGDRFILGLRRLDDGPLILEHLTQGAFRVRQSASGEPLVRNDLTLRGLTLDAEPGAGVPPDGATFTRDGFVELLRELRDKELRGAGRMP